jgi:hypothetical protein
MLNTSYLVRFLKRPYFTASQYFLPIKRTSLIFRAMNTVQQPVVRTALAANARSCMYHHIVVGPSKNSHIAISVVILY